MKYIVLERNMYDTKQRVPIIFPDYLVHADIAVAMKKVPGMEKAVAASAGTLASFDIDAEPTGKSDTLSLTASDGDGDLIKMHDYLSGL
jgi:hypothetical protein